MYKGRFFVREQVWICGGYMDADIFPVYQKAGKRRGRCKPTSEVQKSLNQRNSSKKATRLAHLNFGPADIALHLTYREPPESPERAQRDLQNFLRRVKRQRAKEGLPPLKYMTVTEVGGNGRAHHHAIMSGGMSRDALEGLWGKGYANSKRLQFGPDGIAGLTKYVTKGRQFYKRWNQSRNLAKPEPVESVLTAREAKEIAADLEGKKRRGCLDARYPGWELTDATCERNAVNGGVYIRLEMRRQE